MNAMRMNYSAKSLKRFPSLDTKRDNNNLSLHMLLEDLHLAVLPIGGNSQYHPNFSIDIIGNIDNIPYIKKLLRSLCNYDHYDLKSTICDAVENIAGSLVYNGKCHFEIAIDDDDPNQKYLVSFTSKRLFRAFRYYVQIVPRADWQLHGKRINFIRNNNIWLLNFPKTLKGTNGYKKTLLKIKKIDRLGPKFWVNNIQLHFNSSVFDFLLYAKKTEIHIHKLTSYLGWDMRSTDQKTKFYQIYKKIMIESAKSIIREHIIDNLNILLSDLGYDCKIVVVGIPSSEEIVSMKEKFISGTMDFKEVLESISLL
ncbi:MAG: hypothetical protein WD469_12750 [Paenibacillaceae bacterium]